ncbi:hypothetical protein BFG52_06850 [Acinetobacter larvae]|uniref:Uncharacterized protein n=2 Tax=Acinetobacter larvae TaxID=1789224 RepID=A0A1B2M443_9GAMM|nr:hypothetical protein BFG52_06850 [Acinetobacter larvae]
MKKIILGIFLFLSAISYPIYNKIVNAFEETNILSFSFNVDKNSDLNDLRVNLYLLNSATASEWYAYRKAITVIDKGKVLSELKSKYILMYEIEVASLSKNLYLTKLSDNVFYRKMDYKVKYEFPNDFNLFTNTDNNIEHTTTLKNIKNVKYYNPELACFEISEITESTLHILQSKSFDELKAAGKIKAKDILKLNQLTNDEKTRLLKIHNLKKFDKPLE